MNGRKWDYVSRDVIKQNVTSLAMQHIYRLIESKEEPAQILDEIRGIRDLHLDIIDSITYDLEDEKLEKEKKQNENVPSC